jgi:hypothetical protein
MSNAKAINLKAGQRILNGNMYRTIKSVYVNNTDQKVVIEFHNDNKMLYLDFGALCQIA